jgi:hypothetical protein
MLDEVEWNDIMEEDLRGKSMRFVLLATRYHAISSAHGAFVGKKSGHGYTTRRPPSELEGRASESQNRR